MAKPVALDAVIAYLTIASVALIGYRAIATVGGTFTELAGI